MLLKLIRFCRPLHGQQRLEVVWVMLYAFFGNDSPAKFGCISEEETFFSVYLDPHFVAYAKEFLHVIQEGLFILFVEYKVVDPLQHVVVASVELFLKHCLKMVSRIGASVKESFLRVNTNWCLN